MSALRISVIIPTRNRPEKLRETLAGLHRQNFPRDEYEIIVVDDGSQVAVSLPEDRQGIRHQLLRLDGVERSAARNAGGTAAAGSLLVFLDDDISVGTDFLAAHWQAHQEWPEALAVGRVQLPPEVVHRPFVRFRQLLEDFEIPKTRGVLPSRNCCTAQNMSISRQLFGALGGFNVTMSSSEDQELALRHTARGPIVYLPEALGIHRDGALDIDGYCRRMEWGYEYMIPFCRSYEDLPANIQRERINGRLRPVRDGMVLTARKLVKSLLATRPVTVLLFGLTHLLEKTAPRSRLLDRCYRLLLGIHIFRGYRKGSKRFPPVSSSPPPVWGNGRPAASGGTEVIGHG